MARINTKRTALFIKSGSTLPVPPANFLEADDVVLVTPTVRVEEYKRLNGKLGANDAYADTCDTTFEGSIAHKMRFQNSAADALDTVPEYGELLKIGGFTETINTATPGQETVTYENTQNPVLGSAVAYMDDNKQTMTGSLACDLTFSFEIGMAAKIEASLSAFFDNNGIATSEANPTVDLSDEGCLLVGCADVTTAGGTTIEPSNISIAMNSEISKFYGMGLKEYQLTDYKPELTVDFYPDNANYNDAITALANQTAETIVIKLGTNNGTMVSGKSVEIQVTNCKYKSYSDSDDQGSIKRSVTYMFTADSAFTIKHGYFA